MKKVVLGIMITLLLVSCGDSVKKMSKEEQAKLVYKAIVLGDNDSYKELNERIKKLDSKKDEESKQQYKELVQLEKKYEKLTEDYGDTYIYTDKSIEVVPAVSEVFPKEGEPININFGLEVDNGGKYVNIVSKEPYTGIAISRDRNGKVEKVVNIENGYTKNLIEDTSNSWNTRVLSINDIAGEKTLKKTFNNKGVLIKVEYIMERYKDGSPKIVALKESRYPNGIIAKYDRTGYYFDIIAK